MQSLFELLKDRISKPLCLVDVGAAGGAIEGWQCFGDKAQVFCFEARDDETADLNAANQLTNIEYVPLALAEDDKGIDLTVAQIPTCSSVYPPIKAVYERYPACAIMRPVTTVHCPSINLDAFMSARGIDRIHAIKLDTQGFELNILRGAEDALRQCLFAVIEVEFNALYEGQPLFCDVDRFMRDRGFVLWRFNNLAHYSMGVIGGEQHPMMIGSDPGGHHQVHFANGQLFWGDALYVKASATALSDEAILRDDAIAGAALVSQWGFWDLALEMVRKSGDAHLLAVSRGMLNAEFVDSTPTEIAADRFETQVPVQRSGAGWTFTFNSDATAGCLVFGPYVRLPEGEHEVAFNVSTSLPESKSLQASIMFDVAQDFTSQVSVKLDGDTGAAALRSGSVRIRFHNGSPQSKFEFRIHTTGKPYEGHLTFHGIELSPNVEHRPSRSVAPE